MSSRHERRLQQREQDRDRRRADVQAKEAKRLEQEKLASRPVLVRTIFGASLLNANSTVHVRLRDSYILKKASELKKGEEVLFSKVGVAGITLEQAEVALAQSPRYAATAPLLFTRLPDDSYTPSFNYALREGISFSPLSWPACLHGLSAAEALSISPPDERMKAAATRIHETLRSSGIGVTETHIRYRWLGGQVLAPAGMDSVLPALLPLAPSVSRLLDPAFKDAYMTYNKIRRAVMYSVSLVLEGKARKPSAKEGGESGDPQQPAKPSLKMSIAPEIELVARLFANDISEVHASTAVLGVKRIPNEGDPDRQRKEGGEFFKGIVTGPATPDIRIKTWKRLFTEHCEINSILVRVFYEFLRRERPDFLGPIPSSNLEALARAGMRARNPMVSSTDLFKIAVFGLSGVEDRNRASIENMIEAMSRSGNLTVLSKLRQIAEAIASPTPEIKDSAELFLRKLHSGELDEIYGFPHGTLDSVLDFRIKCEMAMPLEMDQIITLNMLKTTKKVVGNMVGKNLDTDPESRLMGGLKASLSKKGVILGEETPRSLSAIIIGTPMLSSALSEQIFVGRLTPLEAVDIVMRIMKFYRDRFGGLVGMDFNLETFRARGKLLEDAEALQVLQDLGFGELERLFIRQDQHAVPFFSMPKESNPARSIAVSAVPQEFRPTSPIGGGYYTYTLPSDDQAGTAFPSRKR